MGAKPSTTNGAQSPRSRAFSTSSSSEVVAAPGFRLMRSLGMEMSSDRQRARSLSSVPDLNSSHEAISIPTTGASFDVSASPETDSSSAEEAMGTGDDNSFEARLGRAYQDYMLPEHIWMLKNGVKCPLCSKLLHADQQERHLLMCLFKPRVSYNEDILQEDKGECVICLEELCPGHVIARLPCLCVYHKTCIDRWFEVNRVCPEHPDVDASASFLLNKVCPEHPASTSASFLSR